MLLMLGLRDSQRVDVVAPAGKQTDDASQHAGFVVDQHAQSARLDPFVDGGRGIMRSCGAGIHGRSPYRLRRAKAQSRPRPRLSVSSIHSMACASRSRALRSGPASITSKPSEATRSMTFGLLAASSPATNITDL